MGRIMAEPVQNEIPIGRRNNQTTLGIGSEQWQQRIRVQVVRMIVAAGYNINDPETSKRGSANHALSHPRMRFVGAGVFARERVRQIWIKDQRAAVLHQEKSALPKPPKPAT